MPDSFSHALRPFAEYRWENSAYSNLFDCSPKNLKPTKVSKYCWSTCGEIYLSKKNSVNLATFKKVLKEDFQNVYGAERINLICDNRGWSIDRGLDELVKEILRRNKIQPNERSILRKKARQIKYDFHRICGHGEEVPSVNSWDIITRLTDMYGPTLNVEEKALAKRSKQSVRGLLNDIQREAEKNLIDSTELLEAVLVGAQEHKPKIQKSSQRFFTGWKLLGAERADGSKWTVDEADLFVIDEADLVKNTATELAKEASQPTASTVRPSADVGPPPLGDAPRLGEDLHDFDSVYSELYKPSRVSWSLMFLGSSASRNISSAKTAFADAFSSLLNGPKEWRKAYGRFLARTGDWFQAHIRHGVLSSGRGIHHRDIYLAYREREQNWAAISKEPSEVTPQIAEVSRREHNSGNVREALSESPRDIGLQNAELDELKGKTGEIRHEMLDTIQALEQQLRLIPKSGFWGRIGFLSRLLKALFRRLSRLLLQATARKNRIGVPINLAESIKTIHRRYDGTFKVGLIDVGAASIKASEDARLKDISDRFKALEKSARKLCVDARRVSALVAQLIQDQATIEKIARIIHKDNGGGSAAGDRDGVSMTKEEKIDEILRRRQSNFTQTLRKCGFVNLRDADHAVRAIDYVLNGLANPYHKLNRALSLGGKIDRKDLPDVYADIISNLPINREIILDGGWGRGVNIETRSALRVVMGPIAAAASRVFRLHVGADRAVRYSLKIRKDANGTQFKFGRVGAVGLGTKLYVYFIRIWGKSYAAANAKARSESRCEDLISIKFDDNDVVASKRFLTDMLSGNLDDPYVLLEKADSVATVHAVEGGQVVDVSAYPGWSSGLLDEEKADRRLESNRPGGRVPAGFSGGLSTDLFIRQKGRGYGYDSNDRIHSQTVKHTWHHPLFSHLSFWGEAGMYPRFEHHAYTNSAEDRTYLEYSGVAQRGEVAGAVALSPWGSTSSADRAWKRMRGPTETGHAPESPPQRPRLFRFTRYWGGAGGLASIKPSEYNIVPDEYGNTSKVTWDVPFKRNEKTLNLLKGERREIYESVLDWVSFTNRDHRMRIANDMNIFRSDLKRLRNSVANKAVGRKLAHLDERAKALEKKGTEFTGYADREKFNKEFGRIRSKVNKMLQDAQMKCVRGKISIKEFNSLGTSYKELSGILGRMQGNVESSDQWRQDDLEDEIKISMKLEPNEGMPLNQANIFKIMKKMRRSKKPEILSITGIETRSFETEFNWPILFTFDSSAKLTFKKYQDIYSDAHWGSLEGNPELARGI